MGIIEHANFMFHSTESYYYVPFSHLKTWGFCRIMGRPSVFPAGISAGSARVMDAPGMFVIWRPLQPTSFELSRPSTGLVNLPEGACSKDNFHRNPFVSESLSLVAPYFWLFQWRISTTYILALGAAVRLALPLLRPWSCVISHCVKTVSSTRAYYNCSRKCFVSKWSPDIITVTVGPLVTKLNAMEIHFLIALWHESPTTSPISMVQCMLYVSTRRLFVDNLTLKMKVLHPSKCQKISTQYHSVTSENTLIFSNAVVRI